MTAPKGINADNVTAWFEEHVGGVAPPLSFETIAAGRSNLTFRVTDSASRTWILRRPPTGHVLQSAHDMGREHTIISALQDTPVPVPGIVGLCADETVNDAPFYVMQDVPGTIIRRPDEIQKFDASQRQAISESLVDTLVALHAVDPDEAGVGELGKKQDYIARQLHRWMGQVDKGSDRDLPRLREVHDQLQESIPEQKHTGIVHGDYRLDNCMIGDDAKVAAVLDWELCTLGDVFADVGGLVMYWGRWPDFVSAEEVVVRYGKQSGRDVSDLPYYTGFTNWRLACIIEGVRVRFEKGAMGEKDIGPELQFYASRIDALVETAAGELAKL